jgi:chromosome segregation ATPase
MPKKRVLTIEERLRLLEEAHEQMKQKMDETDGEGLKERLSDLESNYEDLDSRHEELSEKVEDHEGQLSDADSRIDDLESEDR